MVASQVISKRKWRQYLKNRKYLVMFQLPSEITKNTGAKNMTKRSVKILLSTGIKMKGVATISSGTEIYIPKHLQRYFQKADWFDCEIVDDTLYEKSTLDIY